jgi:putative oxidoreductase
MDTGLAVARAALVVLFVFAGAVKFIDISGTAAHIADEKLPAPTILAVAGGALEVICGLMVAVGWQTRFAALALVAYVIVLTFFFHDFWTMPAGREQINQMLHALKNLSIVGGLFVALAEPGRFSFDARRA